MKDNTNVPSDPAKPSARREETIFEAAVKLSGESRVAYLRQACDGDDALRAGVESLLQAHERAGGFLEEPIVPAPKQTIVLTLPPEEKSGDKIGRYKILQKIGEGGCGVVYMAEQEEPVRRRVALKVIKLGMDTKQVIARFEAERQALAMMDHPNIAKVLDAGGTETGRPFFVMELVRGIKITEYCDQNKLGIRERLALFIQVCNAIQHAHQKGIIHRDIKPSNILVTLHDGMAVPKVIDFGIAKATQGRLTDETLFTAFEQFIGTPAYMSPEQAEMSGLDVDTRCDIYALGVLLYELLTGKTPFDAKELMDAGLDGMRRAIREKEPSRPSTRLSTMTHMDLTLVAQRHQLEPPRLIHLLRGDLDWIVMKTLEKDRTRRYETANALATDIQRHLSNEAILARPPSNLYRFQKLARRNKTAFAAVGTGFAALILGLVFCWYLLIQERAAHQRALAAEKEQARMRQEAELHAMYGEKVARAGLLVSRGEVDNAEALINEVPPSPNVAVIYSVVGYMHARQGEWPKAVSNFTMTVNLEPTDDIYYQGLMPLLAYTGDDEGYHRRRQNMLQRFGATSNPKIARRVALNALILPPAAADMETVTKLVNIAVASDPNDGDMLFLKALADYRQGNFTYAAEWFQKFKPSSRRSWNRIVAVQMLQAMMQFRLGQIELARTNLATGLKNAREKMDQAGKDDLGDGWGEWVIAQCLTREARGLFLDIPGGP